MFGTAATTFVHVPSATLLSMAFATFFPSMVGVFNSTLSYSSASHPLPLFLNAEKRLLSKSAILPVQGNVTVRLSVLYPRQTQQAWRIVRLDVVNMSVTVHHHFDYAVDGHSRTYQLHCETPQGEPSVYIVRKTDGFSIPYQSIDAISMIALLRMGLLSEIKNKFYDELFYSNPN